MAFEVLKLWFTEASRSSQRKDALNPVRWLCAIVSVPSLYLASRAQSPALYWFLAFAAAPILLFSCAYVYLLIVDRDRLQSEWYNLRDRALDIIESKGGRIQVSEEGLNNIVNPHPEPRRLAPPQEGGEA